MNTYSFTLQDGETVSFDYSEKIYSEKTPYQYIEIVNTKTFGKGIFIDSKPQSSEYDHFIFNELLAHSALTIHPSPNSVFIAGGGPGSILAEVIRNNQVKEVLFCDLDERAHEVYKKLSPEWHNGAFDDERVSIKFENAREYLENSSELFDVFIIDVPDPLLSSPSKSVFTKEFYNLVKKRMNKGGIIVSQAGRTNINNLKYHSDIYVTLKECFANAYSFKEHIPFYAESWGFVWASDELSPLEYPPEKLNDILSRQLSSSLRSFNGYTHHASFSLPNYFQDIVNEKGEVRLDSNPLIVS